MDTRKYFSQFEKVAEGTIFPGYSMKIETPIFDSQISIASYMKPAYKRDMFFLEPWNIGYEIHFACSGSAANAFFAEFSDLVAKYNHLSSTIIPITPKPTKWQQFKRLFQKPKKSASTSEIYDALKALVEYAQSGTFDALKRKELITKAETALTKYEKDRK